MHLLQRVEQERTLTDPQRDEFEDMLRALTLEKRQIKEAMGFALDNADAAGEIVEVLTESLTLKETPIPTKVARLMLVSDILHNSSAPVKNASAYRTKFETTLPDIMESFNDLYRSITGRITAEALKERVLKVLQVWADWFLFSDAYVSGLRSTFLRSGNSGVVLFHSICGDAPEIENKPSVEGVSEMSKVNQDAALAMGKGAAMKELLDLPLTELERRCRLNGLSIVGGREIMVARLLSLEEVERQKGDRDDDIRFGQPRLISENREINRDVEPVGSSRWNHYEEDVVRSQDKVSSSSLVTTFVIPQPELKAFTKKRNPDPILPISKWAREDNGSDDEGKRSGRGLGLSYSSSGSDNSGDDPSKEDIFEVTMNASISSHQDASMNEEQRQKLRRLELSVMEYRESLEERGIKSLEEIEKKVAVHRRRLQSEFGISDSDKNAFGKKSSSMEGRGKRDDSRDSSRKRIRSQSHSLSPQRKLSTRDREGEKSRSREGERDRSRETDRDRDRRRKGR
ncbi:hypothetical protein GIB67_007895 [Kingdonia uniflora]|uniref:CID domain-containing protein n=1 Tax=Kingdonia uniflora TaxID=39325 RepID=A0A7J7PB62_9MAGN|nr:hypothetical protein GIB67_007895 [Kingdonia uniflora]